MAVSEVTVYEVGPRDGLQNEGSAVATAVKVELIERLAAAGLPAVEATSFVHPKWVPQMADATDVVDQVQHRQGVRYPVLVPNEAGLRRALDAGVREIAIFGSVTETFARKNLNCTVEESMVMFAPVVARARAAGLRVRGYLSMVFGDPWEGEVPVAQAVAAACRMRELGVDEVSLGDTIGVATPAHVRRVLTAVAGEVPREALAVHFHDTYGQALANVLAGCPRPRCRHRRQRGGRPGRVSVREERNRQSRHRGSCVHAQRAWVADGRRPGRGCRDRLVDQCRLES